MLRPSIKTAVRERNWWRVSKIARGHPPTIIAALLRAKSVTGSVPDLQTSECNVSLSPRDGSPDVSYLRFIPSNLQRKRRDASDTQTYEKYTKFGNKMLIPIWQQLKICFWFREDLLEVVYMYIISLQGKNIHLCKLSWKKSNIIARRIIKNNRIYVKVTYIVWSHV